MRGFCLEVAGDYACFTRPEMKVERVSYDCITPSAARGVFTAIYWHPGMTWRITRIELLNPIRWANIRRNELAGKTACFIEDKRVQRASRVLRDVRYRLYGEFDYSRPSSYTDEKPPETEGKHADIFRRRAEEGRCFSMPYLGCREFSCKSFRLVGAPDDEPSRPIAEDRDFGFMLYDLDFSDPRNPSPMYYRPQMKQGVIKVPDVNSDEVFK